MAREYLKEELEARQRMEDRSPLGRLVWAFQDVEDDKAFERAFDRKRRLQYPGSSVVFPLSTDTPPDYANALDVAWRIAADVHGRQTDKYGLPYLFHCVRVAMRLEGPTEYAAGLLHDVLEDSDPRRHQELTKRVQYAWGSTMVELLYALTKQKDEPYMDYIQRVGRNQFAVKVKMADLADNSNERRLRLLPAETADRLRKKYSEALEYLKGVQSV